MAFKIEVDNDKCIGCGACEAQCPVNFEVKEGKAVVKEAKVEELGCNKDAQEACPVDAIIVTEE